MGPAVTKIVRVGTWTLIGILTVLGLLTAGTALVLPALVATGVGAVVGWALTSRRSVWRAVGLACACGAGVLAIAGLAVLAGPATVVAAPAVVAPLLLTRSTRTPAAAAPVSGQAPSSLASLSNAQLAREWHASYNALAMARDLASMELICAVRRRQLDEIERRAPGDFQRWISSGSWVRGDSAPFLGG
ncbi:MAG: hypothetical protein JOY78_17070 [Pseudonocardia sp.]|nr:hypothetical protein [Pseudonocardia sp.]